MRYSSTDARAVTDHLLNYGVELTSGFWELELQLGLFYTSHIISVIDQILPGGNVAGKLEKIDAMGWAYFAKPVGSMLGARGAGHRTPGFVVIDEDGWHGRVYATIANSFARFDWARREMELILEIAKKSDPQRLALAMQACGENRSIFYLHGVVRREYDSARGRIIAIQENSAQQNTGWKPPEGYERMDAIERKELDRDWRDRLNSLSLIEKLNAENDEESH